MFQPDVPELDVKNTVSLSESNTPKSILFRDAAGNVVDVSKLKGKVVFINFWATWCPPCIAEMPAIDELYGQFKDDENVVFILAEMDNDYPKAEAFMKRKGFAAPVYTPMSALPEVMYTGTLPTTVILDRSGNISFNHEGTADYSNPKIATFIRNLATPR
jgi:thiol-disulfide isomerase/thioredoxin